MDYEIIDFHTHPYVDDAENMCIYKAGSFMNLSDSVQYLQNMGISRICGSVIGGRDRDAWDMIRRDNDRALFIRDMLGDFYVPGFHVHPDHVEESCREIERMHALGIRLVGELVPRFYGWEATPAKNLMKFWTRQSGMAWWSIFTLWTMTKWMQWCANTRILCSLQRTQTPWKTINGTWTE